MSEHVRQTINEPFMTHGSKESYNGPQGPEIIWRLDLQRGSSIDPEREDGPGPDWVVDKRPKMKRDKYPVMEWVPPNGHLERGHYRDMGLTRLGRPYKDWSPLLFACESGIDDWFNIPKEVNRISFYLSRWRDHEPFEGSIRTLQIRIPKKNLWTYNDERDTVGRTTYIYPNFQHWVRSRIGATWGACWIEYDE